jgi:predicted nucleic acid-binding protein
VILADTNVLLDVVGGDPVWADWSRRQLNAAAATDDLVINDIIYAELSVGYQRIEQLDEMLAQGGIALAIPRPALHPELS